MNLPTIFVSGETAQPLRDQTDRKLVYRLRNSRNAVSFSSVRTSNRFPSRCTSTIQIVRPLESRYVADPLNSVPDLFPSLRNEKKLSCVWIFYDGPGSKTGDIDILSLLRCIRTRDHAFPAWDGNSIGQISFCFFYSRGFFFGEL